MKKLDVIAAMLLVVGGLNWGSIALGGPDLVATLFGAGTGLSRLVYGLVGLSALWQVAQWQAIQKRWLARPAGALAAAMLMLFAAGSLEAQSAPAMSATAMGAEPATVVDAAVAMNPTGYDTCWTMRPKASGPTTPPTFSPPDTIPVAAPGAVG